MEGEGKGEWRRENGDWERRGSEKGVRNDS